ncbi:hypothetical protein [Sandaracinus amylolyticus]|uniref:hypothetical protein n=1 Tax=Sandaracinus amylolyticus TaxID=927083 RepID=UPI001F386707|nr:hypothetical protein [Sandaracinus amylolyticus]UJR85381.1 Hypothetical protein I5071_74610 [Sandaracinus amylolyticus]
MGTGSFTRVAVALVAASALGCASGPRSFSTTTPIVWRDDDRHPFGPRPDARHAPEIWDAADNLLVRPAARALAFDTSGESVNVNALDEVPDSSFFENRASMRPEAIAAGACGEGFEEPVLPWRVVSGKRDGATSGFVIEDARGRRFVLKADRETQPEQTTAADAIVAALYHAAGYHVPCNRVVYFERAAISLDPRARLDGDDRAMTEEDLAEIVAVFQEGEHGLRATASLVFDSPPLGPWDYRGTWDVDLNDVVPHEDRRELRAMFVMNAWLDHWDARQHNTLATWEETGDGRGWVLHRLVDFGDALGYLQGSHRQQVRYGHSQWVDRQHVVEDLFTLGLVRRPWDDAQRGPTWPILGYYDVERFDPEQWRPNYWNGAFERRTERDCAWMARIVSRFGEAHLRAAIALGRFSDPRVEERLLEVMLGRRERVLERWLTRLSPLASPVVRDRALCLDDLAVSSGLRTVRSRAHAAAWIDEEGRVIGALPVQRDGARVCVAMPDAARGYAIVRVRSATIDREQTEPIDVHLAQRGDAWRVVGLEREGTR